MKKNVTILAGVVVLLAVIYFGQAFIKKGGHRMNKGGNQVSVGMKAVTGEVVRAFEGDNKAEYSFEITEDATTTVGMTGALVTVHNATGTVAALYFSYEGARGYTPLDYINNVIASKVAVVDTTSTSTVGTYTWQGAEAPATEWSIAPVLDGKWLVVVENSKANHDQVQKILSMLIVK